MTPPKRPRGCAYCAHAPVSHRAQWIISTVDCYIDALVPRFRGRFSRKLSLLLERFMSVWSARLERVLAGIAILLGITKINAIPSDSMSGRLRVTIAEAQRRGIRIEQLSVFGRSGDTARALLPSRKNSSQLAWHYFASIPLPPWLRAFGWIDDKGEFNTRFRTAGLPVAKSRTVRTRAAAMRAARAIGWPVIVKPYDGSRARHTSTNISNEQELLAAFDRAQQLCAFVLVEQHIVGDTYRATCVGGACVAVMHYQKPGMLADGVRTCDQLRRDYNASIETTPHVDPVADTPWFRDALARQSLTSDSVPGAGRFVTFAEHSERTNGGKNRDITDTLPASTKAVIEQAAALAGNCLIGFDLISNDLTNPDEPFAFIEGNSLPFIDIHHDPTEGEPRNVAGAVFDLWF